MTRNIRNQAIQRSIYNDIKQHSEGEGVIIYVSDRRHAKETALGIVQNLTAELNPHRLLGISTSDIKPYLAKIHDLTLKHSLKFGIGFVW